MAVRILTERSNFALCCRLWRVVGLLLRNLSEFLPQETEIFVSFAVRILDDQEATVVWERALVLEVLAYQIFSDANVCHRIYTLCDAKDEGVRVFQDVITALCRLVATFIKADLAGTTEIKVPFLDQFDKTSAPLVPDGYILSMAFKSLEVFVLNLDARLMELFAASYTNILKAMINIHSRKSFEEHLLPCLGKFITLVVFGAEAVKTTVEAVAELALQPAPIKSPILKTKRQSKSSLNNDLPPCPFTLGTVLCLLEASLKIVEYLDEAWKTVIWVIRSIHQLANHVPQYQMDEKLLTTTLAVSDKILQVQLSDKAFEAFTTALTSLSEDNTEAVYWSLSRLNTVYALNMSRFMSSTIPAGWNTLKSKLIQCLRTSILHLATKDVLLATLQLYIEEFKKHADRPKEAQQRPFELLSELDDISIILEGVQICLQGIGDTIPSSWPLVMKLLQKCLESPNLPWPDLQRAFAITKLITSDFLSHLNEQVGLELIKLVTTFCHIRVEEEEMLNISLTSIAMLWDICDTLKDSVILMDILDKLVKVGGDLGRFELRNSAVPTAFRILDSRIDQLNDKQMKHIRTLLFKLVDSSFKLREGKGEDRSRSTENLRHSFNSYAKQCDETLELVAEGLTSLWTAHFERFYACKDIEDRWEEHLLILQRYVEGSDSEVLVSTGILGLFKLLNISNKNPWLWDAVWRTWLEVGKESGKPFTQAALLKHIGMFSELHIRCSEVDQEWVDSTLRTIDRVLTYNTIDGPTKDRNVPSELQRACLDSCNELAKEFRGTIIKQYSQWMCLCLDKPSKLSTNLLSPSTIPVDPVESIFRRSMSTTFSGIDIDADNRSPETTFIAMALRLFQEIEALLKNCTDEDIIGTVVDGLVRFVRNKYHTPRQGTSGLQLWVPALNLLKTISKRVDRLAWSKIVSASVDFIRITRIQDPPPHPTMITQKEVDEDEVFECDFIEKHLIETDLIKEASIADALTFASKYLVPAQDSKEYFEDGLDEHNMDILSSFFQRDSYPATKIRFIESCLKQILESPDIPVNTKLDRIKTPIEQFLNEKPYWGPIPLPKHRQLELDCILSCLLLHKDDSGDLVRPLYSIILNIIAACTDKDKYGILQYQVQGYKTFEDMIMEKAHLLIASLKM